MLYKHTGKNIGTHYTVNISYWLGLGEKTTFFITYLLIFKFLIETFLS